MIERHRRINRDRRREKEDKMATRLKKKKKCRHTERHRAK